MKKKSQSYLEMLAAALGKHPETAAGNLLLFCVSGGADSIGLFYGGVELSKRMGFRIAVCHVNHGIRGDEADGDEAFVADLCKRHNIPLYIKRLQFMHGEKVSEDALRQERLNAICACARKVGASAALLAHQRDDLAETFMMRLLRGGGLRGLAGFRERADWGGITLLRPLRNIPRSSIIEYLESRDFIWREDSTNCDLTILRNKIRQQVFPFLQREIAPDVSEKFAATANHFGELFDYVINDASLLFQSFLKMKDAIEWLNLNDLNPLPDFIISEILRLWMRRIKGISLPPSRKSIEALMRMIREGQSGELLRFGGGALFYKDFQRVMGFKTDVPQSFAKAEIIKRLAPFLISIQNQELGLPFFKDSQTAITVERQHIPYQTKDMSVAICSANEAPLEAITIPVSRINFPLSFRTRRSGDGINFYGVTKPLKKWFIEKKIPVPLRDHCVIIADQKGVLWASGMPCEMFTPKDDETVLAVLFQ